MSKKRRERTPGHEALAAFGIDPERVGAPSPLPPPDDEAAEGFVGEAPAALSRLFDDLARGPREDEDAPAFHGVAVPAAAGVGVDVLRGADRAVGVWKLRTNDGGRFHRARRGDGAETAPGHPVGESWAFDPDDRGTFYVREDEAAPVFLEREDGLGLVIDLVGRTVAPVVRRELSLRQPTPLSAPLAEWLAGRDDPWLAEQLERRVDEDDAYEVAAAVALFERGSLPTAADRAALQRFLAGGSAPELGRARQWVRGLSADELQSVSDLATAAAHQWQDRLDGLAEDHDPFDEGWLTELRALLHERDDLEGIRVLLAEVERDTPLATALAALDRVAGPFAAALPRGLFRDDERLLRAARVAPDRWWVGVIAR